MSNSDGENGTGAQASHAGVPCDVWALGCLLYELVAGTVLFPSEPEWSKFYMTVTDPQQVIVAYECIEHVEQVKCLSTTVTDTVECGECICW